MINKSKGPGSAPPGPGENEELTSKNIIKDFSVQSIPHFITVGELATMLKISKGAIYNMTSSGTIPHYKGQGLPLRFELSEVMDWIKKRKVEVKDRNYDFRR